MQHELNRIVDALSVMVWPACGGGDLDFLNRYWRDYTGLSAGEGLVRGPQVVGRQRFWRSSKVCFDGRPERPKEFVDNKRSLISVVDDDESIRESLPDLLRIFGFEVETFSSAEEFLASDELGKTSCLILDIAMPGMTGLDLQRELKFRQHKIPIIFITASRDESIRSHLLKEGAVECLFKPFSDSDLLKALNTSLPTN